MSGSETQTDTQQEASKSTTIASLKQSASTELQHLPEVDVGFTSLRSFQLTQRVAQMFAASSIVPEQFQNNIANCAIALEMAQRIGASPLMVMQNLDVIYGRPSWRAKFLIACFNQCGRFEEIQYRWTGTKGKDTWGAVAQSMSRRTKKLIEGPEITIALAKEEGWYEKKGSKWKTIPQLMLMYRAGAWLVNTHAPEISMGLPTVEEVHDVFDGQRGPDGNYRVDLDSLRAPEAATEPPVSSSTSKKKTEEPEFDEQSALQALSEAGDKKALNEAWDAIVADYDKHKRQLPVAVEARFKDRKAYLEQIAERNKQLDL